MAIEDLGDLSDMGEQGEQGELGERGLAYKAVTPSRKNNLGATQLRALQRTCATQCAEQAHFGAHRRPSRWFE